MKKLIAIISAIALSPLPAIASPEPLGLPACYMIRSDGKVLNLDAMCGNKKDAIAAKNPYAVTADLVCKAFASDALTATNQFMRDKAMEGLRFCRENKASIQKDIDNGN